MQCLKSLWKKELLATGDFKLFFCSASPNSRRSPNSGARASAFYFQRNKPRKGRLVIPAVNWIALPIEV